MIYALSNELAIRWKTKGKSCRQRIAYILAENSDVYLFVSTASESSSDLFGSLPEIHLSLSFLHSIPWIPLIHRLAVMDHSPIAKKPTRVRKFGYSVSSSVCWVLYLRV